MDTRIPRKGATGGFTLMDTLLVVIVVGILGMAVAPQLHSFLQEIKLNAAAGELVDGLEYAAALAVIHQRPFGVRAAGGSSVFSVFDSRFKSDAGAHPGETPPVTALGVVLHPVDRQWYVRDLSGMGATISAVSPAGGVVFHPQGHCASLSSVLIVTLGSDRRTVTVNGISGRISVQ